jgi:hypothetical protein
MISFGTRQHPDIEGFQTRRKKPDAACEPRTKLGAFQFLGGSEKHEPDCDETKGAGANFETKSKGLKGRNGEVQDHQQHHKNCGNTCQVFKDVDCIVA